MTPDDWIKVTTRVPAHSNPVLTCCGWDGDEPTYYLAFFDNGKWRDNVDGQDLGNEIVEWMEIVPPPRGGGKLRLIEPKEGK